MWTVIEGDAWQLLPYYAEASVDHVITDPPFLKTIATGSRSGIASGAEMRRGVKGGFGPRVIPIDFGGIDGREAELAKLLVRAAKRWAIAFCAFEQLGDYKRGADKAWVRPGVWRKLDATPQFSGDRPGVCGEALAIMHRPGKKRWNSGGMPAYWLTNTSRGLDRYGGHPTPKPVKLMMELVAAFTEPGETVLDPFCGSGTTGIACMRIKRNFVGIELNPEYVNLARRRLEAEGKESDVRSADRGQMPLFGDDQ